MKKRSARSWRQRGSTRVLLTSVLGALALAFFAGCVLETREEQEEKQVMQKQVQTLQKSTADVSQRFSDIEEDARKTSGHLEATDNSIARLDQKVDKNDAALEAKLRELQEKMAAYREALSKLEQGLSDANAQIQALSEAQKRAPATPAPAPAEAAGKSGKAAYASAEEYFNKKDWKAAIPEYESYRKQNPNGKRWREATYKIGVSFQELGMADESKAFFDELIGKAAGSPEAKKAQYRLKAMKKQ